MSTLGDWTYWLLGLGVLIVNAVLVYVAWWALFADKPRGRRRCPRCWYNMAYSPGMTCGECGLTATRESQLHRTHRRYRVAAVAIFSSVAIVLFVTERVTQRGIPSMMPARVLIWMLPLMGGSNSSLHTELMSRANFGLLSQRQWSSLIERSAAGDWSAAPTSDAWINKYGNFLGTARHSLIDNPPLEKFLLDIPPRVDLTTREVWPRGMPVTLAVQVRDWWPWGMECRIRAQPRMTVMQTVEPITFYRTADSRYQRTPFSLHLPPLDESVKEIVVDFQIERRRLPLDKNGQIEFDDDEDPADENWEPILTQTMTVSTRAEGELQAIAKANGDAALTQAMMKAFSTGVVRWRQGRSPVRFSVAAPETFVPAFDDTAVGVSVELLCDGEVARRLNMWWLGGAMPNAGPRYSGRNYGFEVHQENLTLLRQANADDGRWKIRVRSDPQIALRAGTAKKYWEGEFTIPLKLEVRQDTAPPRPWRVR